MFSYCSNAIYSVFFWIVNTFKNIFSIFVNTKPIVEKSFHLSFEEKFGSNHPKFFQGTVKELMDKAKNEHKVVLISLYSQKHLENSKFCQNVISNNGFIEFVDKNFLFYAQDISNSTGFSLSNKLRCTTFPFLCVLAVLKNNLQVIKTIEGETDLNMIIGHLVESHETAEAQLIVEREEQNIRDFDRIQREEQDRAYQESLQKDRKKEEERKKKEEEEKKRIEEEKIKKELELELEKKKKEEIENSKKNRIILKDKFKEEPKGDKTTLIRFRFPDGSQIQRRFLKEEKVEILYEFIHQLDFNQSKWFPKENSTFDNYELTTGLPKKQLDRNLSLIDAGCVPNQTVYVRDNNEDE